MHFRVVLCAERDQVLFRAVARTAAELHVMDLQVGHRAARLKSTAIPTQHSLQETLVPDFVEPQAHGLWANRARCRRPERFAERRCNWQPGCTGK